MGEHMCIGAVRCARGKHRPGMAFSPVSTFFPGSFPVPPVHHSTGMVRTTRLAMGFLVAVGIASLIRPASSQQLRWQVPLAGAVEYQRSGRAQASATCTSKSAAKVAALALALPARYLRQLPPAPFLCEGELRRDRRALSAAVADLRDVLRAMAFDLSSQSLYLYDL